MSLALAGELDWETALVWVDERVEYNEARMVALAPSGLDYRHHQAGEDNADAHLKRTLMGHQAILPMTNGTLDLGPREQVCDAEFDGQRSKRVVVKVMGQ